MNATQGPASPLPEGRADGRATEFYAAVKWAYDLQCTPLERGRFGKGKFAEGAYCAHRWWWQVLGGVLRNFEDLAAPVVAVPEAGERRAGCECPGVLVGGGEHRRSCGAVTDEMRAAMKAGLAAHPLAPVVGEREDDVYDPTCGGCPTCGYDDPVPAVPVGVQPASEAATSATDRAVPTRPEPAEEAVDMERVARIRALVGIDPPAVPVVHPEPAPESSDSVAELVADTTRSGDRAGNWYRVLYEDKSANRVGYVSLVMAEADREVAAAVAAVRADTVRLVDELIENYVNGEWTPSSAVHRLAAQIRGDR